MATRRQRRRGRKARRRARRALSLTAWRAVIVGQAQRDLARHGRLQALAALVLSSSAEVRDMEIFQVLAGGVISPIDAVRGRLEYQERDLYTDFVRAAHTHERKADDLPC